MTDEEIDAKIIAAVASAQPTDIDLGSRIEALVVQKLAEMRAASMAVAQIKRDEDHAAMASAKVSAAANDKAIAANVVRLVDISAAPSVRLGGLARQGFEALATQEFDGVTVTPEDDGRFKVLAGERDALSVVGWTLVQACEALDGHASECARRGAKAIASGIGVSVRDLRAA